MSWEQAEIRELKVNRYVVVDDEPCRILSIQMSKLHPVTHKVRVPMIDKRKAQVLSMHGNVAQLMDLATYETFELPVTAEYQDKIEPGGEIMYLEALGRRKLSSL